VRFCSSTPSRLRSPSSRASRHQVRGNDPAFVLERTSQAQRRERRGQSLPRWHFSVVWEHEGVGVAVTAVEWVARKWASNPSRRTCLQGSGSARPRRKLLLLQSRGSFWLKQVEVVGWQASAAGRGLVAILLLRVRETGDMGH
jgi:hypothetical protein